VKEPSPFHATDGRWRLVQRYVDGLATSVETLELEAALKQDPEFRASFLAYVQVDSALEGALIVDESSDAQTAENSITKPLKSQLIRVIGFVCVIGVAAIAFFKVSHANRSNTEMAVVGSSSSDVRWVSDPLPEGASLLEGAKVKLAKGTVEIDFGSGAMTRLHGPAHFEIISSNSGFLHYGETFSRADNEESMGFTIQTHSGNFVDQGTEFLTTADPDGFSQLHVTSGAVDADVPGLGMQRVQKGSSLGIEPGEVPVLIRIEPGDESPDFKFPTIPPPSNQDYANASQGRASVEWWPTDETDERNDLSPNSGQPELLIDGIGQTGEDLPGESLFFRDGANGLIVLDLGREVPVSTINTYSWHRSAHDPEMRRRAVQRYTLWGRGDTRPSSAPQAGNHSGWTRIARVNTDAFFGVKDEPDRPPQQGCSIFSGSDAIGSFRYLLFEVSPTPMPDGMRHRHTFFGEIDVFTIDLEGVIQSREISPDDVPSLNKPR